MFYNHSLNNYILKFNSNYMFIDVYRYYTCSDESKGILISKTSKIPSGGFLKNGRSLLTQFRRVL